MRKNGYGEYPPVEYVSVDGKKIIDNGHHRVEAAKKAGLSEIPAKEVDPTKGTNYLKEAQEAAAEQDSRLR
jgi:ParB-like chromosome segregation protein Spo0J